MTFLSTKEFSQALEWASEDKNFLEVFQTYCPESNFYEAYFDGASFSFSIQETNLDIYLMGLGPHPFIPSNWSSCSISRASIPKWHEKPIHRADWDFYSIETADFAEVDKAIEIKEGDEIERFLKKHAPDSSVFPGDQEVIFWAGARSESQELVAVGVAVRWRSGRVMLASIATHTNFRGEGIAQKLVKSMLATGHAMRIDRIGLGVRAENTWARKAYENIGFKCVAQFSAYSKAHEQA